MSNPLIRKLQNAGGLSDASRQLLDDLWVETRHLPPRRDIIQEGDKPLMVNLILEGWACRYKMLPDGGRQITSFMVPGDFCDLHVAILGEMDHSIASLGPVRIAAISRDTIARLIQTPAIAHALWWATLVDEAVLRAWIVNLGRRDAFERVAHMICEMHARLHNIGMAPAGHFAMPITQDDLADALGLTPVHINRVLRRLRGEGLLTLKKQEVVILDVPTLQRVAGFDPNYLHLKGYIRPDARET